MSYAEFKATNPDAKGILSYISHNLKAQQIKANYTNQNNLNMNGSAQEFYDWYKSKMSQLKEESNLKATLPSEAIEEVAKNIVPNLNSYLGKNNGFSSGNSSRSGPSADAMLQSQTMQDYINMIQKTTDANNAWAAEQAQKQMDFQKMMSDTAHQREVADLKAAGLNPVLSAGAGSGASSTSGAMAQPDTSNSSLIGQLAMQAVESLGTSAIQVADGYHSRASNSFKNNLIGVAQKYFIPALARGAAAAITKGLF